MVRLSLFSLIFLITMAGCTTQRHYWSKPGGFNQAQFSADELECVAVARRLGTYYGGHGDNPHWISCMQSKGWVIQKSETVLIPLF